MKHKQVIFAIVWWCSLTGIVIGCKEDDPVVLNTQQLRARELRGAWTSAAVVSSPVSGSDGTLESLSITFETTDDLSPSTFSAFGADQFFKTDPSSTWTWEDADTNASIILYNVSPVSVLRVEEITNTELVLSFTLHAPAGGRGKGIGGYQIRLERM